MLGLFVASCGVYGLVVLWFCCFDGEASQALEAFCTLLRR